MTNTDKVDRKVASVPIATYAYRHEAEFAAGFLDDAGIAYRLQIDDAAMTMSMGSSVTLWVRGIDVPRAREILELPDGEKLGTLALQSGSVREPHAAGGSGGVQVLRPGEPSGPRSLIGRTVGAIRALLRALSGRA